MSSVTIGPRLVFIGVLSVGVFTTAACLSAADRAPRLGVCDASDGVDLGLWDGVWQGDELDFLILRRGATLFSLPLNSTREPKPLGEFPTMSDSRIIWGGRGNDRLWVFCESPRLAPFALDVNSGTIVSFEIDGLKIPGSHTPSIQSWVHVPHLQAAVLMISGGDRATWPRPGNRPMYFWFSLKTGKVQSFPAEWGLDYLSADQSIAVFQTGLTTRQAIDVKTGNEVESFPDRRQDVFVPFEWTNTDHARPLFTPDFKFVGLSDMGKSVPLQIRLQEPHVPSVKVATDWAAFHLRGHGAPRTNLWSLWFCPFQENAKPIHLAKHVHAYEILGPGICAHAVSSHRDRGASTEQFFSNASREAFVFDARSNATWNVLDGIERLPELAPEISSKGYVNDKMSVSLIRGFGADVRSPLVLCLFAHSRYDMRAFIGLRPQQANETLLPQPHKREPYVERQAWRRAVLLNSDGKRFQVSSFPPEFFDRKIWLHNSGRLVLGEFKWINEDTAERVGKMQLTRFDLTVKVE